MINENGGDYNKKTISMNCRCVDVFLVGDWLEVCIY